jgi:hypothetical protein
MAAKGRPTRARKLAANSQKSSKKQPARKGKKRGKGKPFVKGDPRINRRGRKRQGENAADYVKQAIDLDELLLLIVANARKGKVTAQRMLMEYGFGRPWSEAEVLADREIKEAQARIDAAAQKGNGNGDSKESVGKDAKGAGG